MDRPPPPERPPWGAPAGDVPPSPGGPGSAPSGPGGVPPYATGPADPAWQAAPRPRAPAARPPYGVPGRPDGPVPNPADGRPYGPQGGPTFSSGPSGGPQGPHGSPRGGPAAAGSASEHPYGPYGSPGGGDAQGAAEDRPTRRGRRLCAPVPPRRAALRSLRLSLPGRRGRRGEAGDGGGEEGTRTPGEPGAVSPAVYFVAAGVVLIVVLIVVAGFMLLGRGAPKTAAPAPAGAAATGPLPSAYSMASSTKVFGPIAGRRADPRPLAAGEVAAPKTISDTDAKASLKLATSKLDVGCSGAIWGGGFATVLQRAGCTQVSRAVYTDKRYAAMVTIFNVADAAGADRVVAAVDPRAGQGFPQSPSAAVSFNQGFSTARGVAMGHYAVITWVRRADGSGDETDPGLVSLLVAIGPPPAVLNRVADHGG